MVCLGALYVCSPGTPMGTAATLFGCSLSLSLPCTCPADGSIMAKLNKRAGSAIFRDTEISLKSDSSRKFGR
jgi:hypothetical protein